MKTNHLSLFLIISLAILFSACNEKNEPEENEEESSTTSYIEGMLSGEFSVGPNAKVSFSQGNLQYVGKWQFANNQWECFGESQFDNHRDLFGWGTQDTPNKVSYDYDDYSNTYSDWGKNPISNGGNEAYQWSVLSQDQWEYLCFNRPNAYALLALGSVNGVNGLIILPDEWILPEGVSFSISSGVKAWHDGNDFDYYYYERMGAFTTNTYTATQWETMEINGAVFLPAAFYEKTPYVDKAGLYGNYWSDRQYWRDNAFSLFFGCTSSLEYRSLNPKYISNKRSRYSVRLVRYVR